MTALVAGGVIVIVVCAAAAAAAGWAGVVWAGLVLLGVAALLARLGLEIPAPTRTRPAFASALTTRGFTQYEHLEAMLRWALPDGRYFARVLAPELRRIAVALVARRHGHHPTDDELAHRLGPAVWALLMADPDGRDRDDHPSKAEIALILTALEAL
jgi:hypothetical protein